VVVAVGLGVVLIPNLIPKELENNVEPTTVPISSASTDDAKNVEVIFEGGKLREIQSNRDGIVTAINFASGDTLKSGDVILEVDNQPVRVEYSEKPFPSTYESAFWIPQKDVVLQKLLVNLGDSVSFQQTLFTILSPLTGAKVAELPGDSIAGTRYLALGDKRFTLAKDGSIPTDSLTTVIESSAYIEALRSFIQEHPDSYRTEIFDRFGAQAVLESPIEAYSVPPSAILVDQDQSTCVFLNGRSYPVTIVGSTLGASLVAFTGEPISEVDYRAEENATCK
jgi:hypothetical protein